MIHVQKEFSGLLIPATSPIWSCVAVGSLKLYIRLEERVVQPALGCFLESDFDSAC
jgi:hypothetical protein